MPPRRTSARHAAQPKSATALPSSPTTPVQSRKSTRRGKPAITAHEPAVGRTAAREVWETLDIRHMILTLLDRRTLFGMMALDKNGVSSVADIVYKSINIKKLKKLTRKNVRREIYCAAVQVLELCPPPTGECPYLEEEAKMRKPPVLFDPQTLLDNIAKWTGIFPRLHTILNEFPSGERDDAYVVRLREGNISIDLRSVIEFTVGYLPFPEPSGPTIPPAPAHSGMAIRHTIGIFTTNNRVGDGPYLGGDLGQPSLSTIRWRRWVYENPNLDTRVTSITCAAWATSVSTEALLARIAQRKKDQCEPWAIRNLWANHFLNNPGFDRRVTECDYADVSDEPGDHDRLLAVIKQRKDDGCEPWAKLSLPLPPNDIPMSFDLFRQVITSLGSGLRVLSIIAPNLREPSDLRTVMSILDSALPQLRELSITLYLECWPENPTPGNFTRYEDFLVHPIPGSEVALSDLLPPLPGLTNLRKLHLDFIPQVQDPRIVARYFAPVGAESCIYLNHGLRSKPFMQACNAMIRQAKFPPYPKSRPPRGGKPNILEALGDDYHLAF